MVRPRDALAGSLSDQGVRSGDAAGKGLLVVVRRWRPYAGARPAERETAQQVFAQAADAAPGLTVAPSPLEDPPEDPLTCLDEVTRHRVPADMGQ
ncbi:barstar family protein [Streptomyces sp. NPDC047706]|uniref:barstar family protein n=1 Tax=Streptomyces sp. NPDC047706 TaxID=3365486 RepID=UPI003722122E